MVDHYRRIKKARCFLVYAKAPEDLPALEANRKFNEFVSDRSLPLILFHDHWIGQAGGVAIFYTETGEEREALFDQSHLEDWHVHFQPLIFSYSPAAFDEQIAYTLRAYRGVDWATLRDQHRPAFGDPDREAQTAEENK
ncbi:MAG: hypothetical protein IIC78_01570 [Chloroflexi bacterium]|nr:hypothetical protein [Chloroflexota bacterium]